MRFLIGWYKTGGNKMANTRFGWHSGVATAKGINIGSSALPQTIQSRGINSYTMTYNTSVDSRGAYIRHYLMAASTGGEALRAYTTIMDVAAGTAHGGHISLSFNASGSITGLGVAARATIHVPNAISGGTYAAVQAEIYGDRATASITGATEYSFIRAIVDGATTDVKATVDTAGYLFSIQGLTVGSGKLFQANTAGAASHALRIKIGSTPYYIMLTDTGA
jgi:hypothetical protein